MPLVRGDDPDPTPQRTSIGSVIRRALLLKADRLYVEALTAIVKSVIVGAEIAIACCLADAVLDLADRPVDLLITDIAVSDGDVLDVLPEWRKSSRIKRALVVTPYKQPHVLDVLCAAPVDGVVDESAEGIAGLTSALRTITSGQQYWSASIAEAVREHTLAKVSVLRELTPTQRLVIGVIGDGCDDAEAASRFGMREETVKSVRRDLHQKLRVQHKGELLRMAALYGFVVSTPYGMVRPGLAGLLAARNARINRTRTAADPNHRSPSTGSA